MIQSDSERRLSEFVDRDAEMKRFQDLVEKDEKLVYVVSGPSGIGKSSLLARMRHHCAQTDVRFIEIVFSLDDSPDYIAIMRRCRDNLGKPALEAFAPLTDLINYYTEEKYTLHVELHGGNVSVGQGMTVSDGATVNTIAGVVIKDSMIVIPRSDLDVSDAERRQRLTQTFIGNLHAAAAAHKKLIVFLDAAEKMMEVTSRWFWSALVPGVVNEKIENVRFVFLTKEKPLLSRDQRYLVDEAELHPLTIPDIVTYMERRGVAAEHRQVLAMMVFGRCQGNPSDVADSVDSFLELQKQVSA